MKVPTQWLAEIIVGIPGFSAGNNILGTEDSVIPEPFLLHPSTVPDHLPSLGEQMLVQLCCTHSHK